MAWNIQGTSFSNQSVDFLFYGGIHMLSKWLTTVEENGVRVETVIEKTDLVEGDVLTIILLL